MLGLKRCQPFLLDVGIPAKMAAAPEGLVRAAGYFWQITWQGITWQGVLVGQGDSDPGFPENYRLGIVSLLEEVFGILVDEYGEADVQTLYEWAQRHFVDQKQQGCLFIWSFLFAAVNDLSNPVPLPLPSATAKQIESSVRVHFGTDTRARETELIASARTVPMSPLERRMVALEVTRPDDIPEAEVLELLQTVLGNQHAYRVWREIDGLLDVSEREALLWWGYEQAIPQGEHPLDEYLHFRILLIHPAGEINFFAKDFELLA